MKKVRIADIELSFEKDGTDPLCNICLRPKTLTEDHVPPKGVVGNDAVIIDPVLSRMATGKPFQHKLISQNGVKFKTICADCNGRMKQGDNRLKRLAREVRSIIESPIYRLRPVLVNTPPNIIMRSVLGHLLAAKTETGYKPFEVNTRPCIQDYSVSIPDNLHLFYWVYPFRTIRIWRDFATTTIPGRADSLASFQLLKFYPLAFLVTEASHFKGLHTLDEFRNSGLSEKADLMLHLDGVPVEDWPESPEDDRMVMLSGTAIKSIFANKRDQTRS